jgi:flagellar capping protein FliD
MRQGIRIFGTMLLAVALCSPVWAKANKGKGGGSGGGSDEAESQAGGLPGLEDRVEADEALIATLQAEVGTLTTEVAALQTAVTTLQSDVTALQTAVTDLAGQNNFAQGVETASTCTLGATSASVVSATFVSLGVCQVTFNKDVSGCSAVASAVGTTGGEISVASTTKTASGDSWNVSSFAAGVAAASDFNLTVTCP